jgi:hypothetical protein
VVALAEYTDSSIGPFYFAGEGTDALFSIIEISQPDCYVTPQATYRAEGGTATNGSDFVLPEGQRAVDGQVEIDFPITDDSESLVEPAVEEAVVVLEANASVQRPSRVPLYIADADGASRVTLYRDVVSQIENEMSVRLPVFRAGPAGAPISVDYTITPGSATPGDDYQAPTEGTLSFPADARLQFIEFSILDDPAPSPEPLEETIQISITPPTGVISEEPSSMTFTILDDDQDTTKPVTRFHHPREGVIYAYGDYRLREMHVFGKDEGLSGIVGIEMALRKNKRNGTCAWWTPGSGFVAGPCSTSARVWMPMEDGGPGVENWPYFYTRDFPRLTPSMGTRVRNYTAWCQGIDGAGNRESTFARGRNLSTFEVRKP